MNKEDGLSEFSNSYLEKTDIKYRQEKGQYFTKKSLRALALRDLPHYTSHYVASRDELRVAELAAGSGEFIDSILGKWPDAFVEAFEIEPELARHCRKRFPSVEIHTVDTLLYEFGTKKYHFTIGNPPYFEMDLRPCKDEKENERRAFLKKEYADVIGGRPNIYALFIKLGVELLEDGGYLSYVVPTSMLNGAYFAKLRKYIKDNCSIVDIIIKDDDHFDDALQNVMILILRKEANNGDFIFARNGITIFTPNWMELKEIYKGSQSIADLGFDVRTGTVVWNQRKEDLSDDPNDTLLIWADNITELGISKENHSSTEKFHKPQYIKAIPQEGPIIVVNRVTGACDKAELRACFVPEPCLCENHVNMIIPNELSLMTLPELLPHIRNPKAIETLRKITGNTQISKTELEKLLPIWIKK